jgi:integrase
MSRMKATHSRTRKQADLWPKEVQPGRAIVRVYRRRTPSGNFAFMVANYADGGRRFDSYKTEVDAMAAADTLAKRIDSRDYVAASMTKDQALEYATSAKRLEPFNVTVDAATAVVAECLKLAGDLDNIRAAAKFWAERHKQITKKPVSEVVTEFLKVKASRGASDRYKLDLSGRLEKFTEHCGKLDTCNVTTARIQEWLDNLMDKQELSAQSYRNNRAVLSVLFTFAASRGYAFDNPVERVERVKLNGGDVEIFTPREIRRLLDTAKEKFSDFLPCIAIGAFAGLRSAEIERLEWQDIHLAEKYIVVAASKAKTASRRIVPITDNLVQWLADYSKKEGRVFAGGSPLFHNLQRRVAAATAVEANAEKEISAQKAVAWKSNGLRHSYASYRFAQTGDAGRVAGELGNSATVIHRHYRELVKPADAVNWFAVLPEQPANVTSLSAAAAKR